MKKITILILLIFVSCGSRKVNKSSVEQTIKKTVEQTIVDTSKIYTNKDLNVKIIDSSEYSEICVAPIDTTKPFIYDNKVFKNAVLKIKKHKNNITTATSEKVSEKRLNAVKTTVKDDSRVQINVDKKDIDKKESLSSYLWILLIIAIAYIAYRVYDKNKYI
jgi:hypothetical protein